MGWLASFGPVWSTVLGDEEILFSEPLAPAKFINGTLLEGCTTRMLIKVINDPAGLVLSYS